MQNKTEIKYLEIFELKDFNLKILMNPFARIFWKVGNGKVVALSSMPWKYQLPFYLKFLHNDALSERYKNFDIIGAIDVYIKFKFCLNEPLDL